MQMQTFSDYGKYLKHQQFDEEKEHNLIFGKDKTEKVVSVELDGEDFILFIENKYGQIKRKYMSCELWATSKRPFNFKSQRLFGNLPFKYIQTFDNLGDFDDFKTHNRFNKNYYFTSDPKESAMIRNGVTYFKGMSTDDVSVLSFDIEGTGLVQNKDSRVLLISNTFRKNGRIIRRLFAFDDYKNDAEMFNAWCKWVRTMDPSIIVGHNIFSYDFPYMMYCAEKAGTKLYLGRDRSAPIVAQYPSKFRKDGSQKYDYYNINIFGREIVDTMFLSIKYDIGRKYVSYGLKQIIKQEGLEKKDRQFYDASKIKDNYKNPNEWKKIKTYAKDDADDSLALYDLMISPYFYLAQSVPKSFQQIINTATGSQLNSFMTRAYLQEGKSLPEASSNNTYEGAISMGNPGVYKDVLKVDVASLYPSIMIEYEVYDKQKDPDAMFVKAIKYFTRERLKNKQKAKETGNNYYKNLEQSGKLLINSGYGFLGAPGLIFNSPENAAFVTRKGREILKKGMNWVESKGYTLVNVDTDSFSYTKNRKVSREEFQQDIDEINSMYPDGIVWEEDGQFSRVIVLKAKNYIMQEENGKIKYKGSALKDQKKETALIELLHEMIGKMLNDKFDEVLDVYHKYIQEAMNIKDISRWTTKKTITKPVLESYKPNKRANERKVLDAMNEAVENGIVESYQEGDKIWVYTAIDGEIQKMSKGEPIVYADGRPKMIPNRILRVKELWNKDEDKLHYVQRVYKTAMILENVLNTEKFVKFHLKSNRKALENLTKDPSYGRV